MAIEDDLKKFVLSKHKSVRAFALACDMPYSTIDNMFKRGVSGTSLSNVKCICKVLNIDINAFSKNEIKLIVENNPNLDSTQLTIEEENLIETYRTLNEEGQERVSNYIEDLVVSARYKKSIKYELEEKQA